MTASPFAQDFVSNIFELVTLRGERHYGEGVSVMEHLLQTAHHARADGAPDALVAACLLHDIGHLLQRHGEDAADRGIDARHERIGAAWLARAFGPAVTEPVRLHVEAKRYLAAFEPGYFELLSPASAQSLALQGGPMTRAEADDFLSQAGAADAIRLRRYDEQGKVAGVELDDLESYRELLCAEIDVAGRAPLG
ncbi:phosphonate degradation HD-domain oxygenase [Phenylobacterium sp.]|uniref:phosphonate degradation HD-domain oxygenase n=1 Tax=Phenylobacterium sp. TaxID=1871053 RepID=UPI00289CB315|nr:phosphonate degradation HD-domain oxygenase [Phenylobacterium sp.]